MGPARPCVESIRGLDLITLPAQAPQTAGWSPQSDLHKAHQEGGFFRTPRPPPPHTAALPCGGRSGIAFRARPEAPWRSDHGDSAPVRPQDPPARILANSGILLFSCVPMFESLLKLHPRDPTLVRLNARGIARMLIRPLPRALRKSPRCTGRPNCQCPPPWVDSRVDSASPRRETRCKFTSHAFIFTNLRGSASPRRAVVRRRTSFKSSFRAFI